MVVGDDLGGPAEYAQREVAEQRQARVHMLLVSTMSMAPIGSATKGQRSRCCSSQQARVLVCWCAGVLRASTGVRAKLTRGESRIRNWVWCRYCTVPHRARDQRSVTERGGVHTQTHNHAQAHTHTERARAAAAHGGGEIGRAAGRGGGGGGGGGGGAWTGTCERTAGRSFLR